MLLTLGDSATDGFGYTPHVVLALYLVMLLVIGVVGLVRSKQSEEDYYLAGRGQGWIVSSLTIMATFFSSFALLGAPSMVYKDGVVFALFALNVPLAGGVVYVLGSRISRIGRAKGFVTPADLLADYYGSPVALRLLVTLVGFVYAVVYIVMQLQAGGFLAAKLFGGDDAFTIGVVALSIVTTLYILIGGMRSVAWTDVIQGGLLIGGMLIAGAAAVAAVGGVGPFFERVSELPPEALSFPGVTGSWTPGVLFTVCVFASIGSMIQPAQWMRYYAAKSSATLRRSALILAVLLTSCFLFGVMLVGLGGHVLYPVTDENGQYLVEARPGEQPAETQTSGASVERVPHDKLKGRVMLPHPSVGSKGNEFDQVLIVVLKEHAPSLFGPAGPFIVSLLLVAILAAAMSTADSNLHAVSAVLTRDIYDRFVRPDASQRERTWVGRSVIIAATLAALGLIWLMNNRADQFPVFAAIAKMGLLAIAFTSQLIPITVDVLFLRRGTRAGAVAGMCAGIAIVFLFTPFFGMIADRGGEPSGALTLLDYLKKVFDSGAWGLIANVVVFMIVSLFTKRPDAGRVREYATLVGDDSSR